jgi:CspA family cold shock protein
VLSRARDFLGYSIERAGLRELNEGQKVAFEIVADKRTERSSGGNLQVA